MPKKTKILYTMPGNVAGGGHLGTLEIMDRSRSFGFEPIAAINNLNTEITLLLEHYKIPYIYVEGYPTLVVKDMTQFLRQIILLWKFIIKYRISLIHLSDLVTGHYGIVAAKLAGIPSVMHMKSLYWTNEYGWSNRIILSLASKIISISDAVHMACLDARLPSNKIITIHDGVDPELFPEKSKKEAEVKKTLAIAENKIVIGFVSRLGVEWKNEPLIYNLARQLNKEFKNIIILIAGGPYDGKEKTFYKSKELAKRLGGNTDIQFLGNIKNVPEILPAMDVLLVPSKKEPFGRVVLEGMAAGLPVIGSNNGGIPEMITDGHNGFLRPPDNIDEWTKIVSTLIINPKLRKEIGINALKTVQKEFTLEKMIANVAQEYIKLLK